MSINNPTKAYERNRNRNRSNHRGILKDENTQNNNNKTTSQVENPVSYTHLTLPTTPYV